MVTMKHSDDNDTEVGFKRGVGNWRAFDLPLERVFEAAERWRGLVEPIDKPWLCWNVEPGWCLLQQKLVSGAGWTPIVGFDPRVGPPPLLDESILVDFNEEFNFPTLYPHFVLEFVFLFAKRLAFWHSDLLLDETRMRHFAELFAQVPDGEMMATYSRGGGFRRFIPLLHRYWELIGCTTRGASQSQFEHGTGWWLHYYAHPNFSGTVHLQSQRWECGFGINAWRMNYGGIAKKIPVDLVRDGHFTRIGNPTYVHRAKINWFRDLNWDIKENFSLYECARKMNISHLL